MGSNSNITKEFLIEMQTVELAGLLHDIGKFEQHTMVRPETRHGELSAQFISQINLPIEIDPQKVMNLVQDHHDKNKDHLNLIDLKSADITSTTMDREEGEEDSLPNQQIESIFSNISLERIFPKLNVGQQSRCYYDPIKLVINNDFKFLMPVSKSKTIKELSNLNKKLWDEFLLDSKLLPEKLDFKIWMSTFESILKKYTFNVLSAGYKTKPTISLYHHLTAVAAIARCSAEYNYFNTVGGQSKEENSLKNEKRYLYVKGDISGIQKFIFKMRDPEFAHKGAGKRLRGRSFIIQLISDAAIHKILDECNLSENHIITNAGGNFSILLANSKVNESLLKKTRSEMNLELVKKFKSDLLLNLAWIEISNEDLENFSVVENKINVEIENEKLTPIHFLLKGELKETFFKPQDKPGKKCSVCENTILSNNNERICHECNEHEKIGELLADTKALIRKSENRKVENDFKFNIFNQEYYFVTNDLSRFIERRNITNGTILLLDELEINKSLLESGLAIKSALFGLSIPKYENKQDGNNSTQTISFDELTDGSIGSKRYAVIKMDVDNLGTIISKGITSESESKRSVAKIKDLSTRLDLFFSGLIPQLAKEKRFSYYYKPCSKHEDIFNSVQIKSDWVETNGSEIPTLFRFTSLRSQLNINEQMVLDCPDCKNNGFTTAIYSVFSGGDDLAYVGPWDMIIDFALLIKDKFEEYTCSNPWITLSGGIGLFQSNTPISDALRITETYLEQSKGRLRTELAGREHKIKNSLTLFGETVLWSKDLKKYPFLINEPGIGDFLKLVEFKDELSALLESDKDYSRSFVINLKEMWELAFKDMSFEEIQLKRISSIEYYPLLAYHIARRTQDERKKDELFNKIRKIMPWVLIPSTWAYYITKK